MSKKIAYIGIFAGIAIAAGIFERGLPAIVPVPGIKLGLANIAVIIALYTLGEKTAIAVSLIRIFIIGFLFSGPMGIIYSLSGGVLSFFAMLLAAKSQIFGVIGVSVLGAFFHSLGQIAIAALLIQSAGIFSYMAILGVSSAVTGAVMGLISGVTLKHLQNIPFTGRNALLK